MLYKSTHYHIRNLWTPVQVKKERERGEKKKQNMFILGDCEMLCTLNMLVFCVCVAKKKSGGEISHQVQIFLSWGFHSNHIIIDFSCWTEIIFT